MVTHIGTCSECGKAELPVMMIPGFVNLCSTCALAYFDRTEEATRRAALALNASRAERLRKLQEEYLACLMPS